jgi:hypothetical protein
MALMVIMFALSQEAFAAGKATIKYSPEAEIGETTFSLYRVGEFGENGTFAFVDPLKDNISEVPNYKLEDFDSEEEWANKWMDSANVVYEYIKQEGVDPIETKTVSKADAALGFQFDATLENGFYLVSGTSSRVTDEQTGKVTYYWPKPMYVMILNDEPTYLLKPDSGEAKQLKVIKQWVGDEDLKDLIRPEKVTLHVMYDGKQKEDIVLPHDGEWFYTWYPEQDEDDPSKWTITEDLTDEKIAQNYTVIDTDDFSDIDGSMTKTITNTYDRYQLEIEKTMKEYIAHKDGSSQGFVFEVWGYAENKEVFHKYAGITFYDNSGDTETTIVKNIPRNVDKVVVKEVEYGNYKPEEAEKTAELKTSEDGKTQYWSASFTNNVEEHDTFDTAVINKYSITGDGVFSFDGKIGK